MRRYKYWTVCLSNGQYYLGKLKIVLNRRGVVDLCELRKSEVKELFEVIKKCQKALKKCFQPDLFNYATLGNWTRHHHWHLIPRYKGKREVNGEIFRDKRWNNPPWPEPSKKIDKETIKKIYNLIYREV